MITSLSNPIVKDLVRLRSRRHRDAEHRFVIEGERAVSMAVEAGVRLLQQVIAPELGGRPLAAEVPTIEMGVAAFHKASIRQNPDGIMAVASHLELDLARLAPRPNPLVLVVESVEKPGNLGGILRTADAVGVDAVVVCDPGTDVHNPNVVRASQGALFTVPIAMGTVSEAIAWLSRLGIALIATTPNADTLLWELDWTGAAAIAIGSEAQGLSSHLIEASSQQARIPMQGSVDSLNASVTAAVAAYEAARQRHQT